LSGLEPGGEWGGEMLGTPGASARRPGPLTRLLPVSDRSYHLFSKGGDPAPPRPRVDPRGRWRDVAISSLAPLRAKWHHHGGLRPATDETSVLAATGTLYN